MIDIIKNITVIANCIISISVAAFIVKIIFSNIELSVKTSYKKWDD